MRSKLVLRNREDETSELEETSDKEESAEDPARASQIKTNTELSHNTLDNPRANDFDSEDEAEADVLSDDDAVQMDKCFIASLNMDKSDEESLKQREAVLRAMEWSSVSSEFEQDMPAYPGLENEEARPVPEFLAVAHSPLLTLFYFMPKSLWVMICDETSRYNLQQIDKRARAIQASQPSHRRETTKQIRRRLIMKKGYQTHDILQMIGLLVARMLCHQQCFTAHWSMVEDGAVPVGTFGRYMARKRCQDILRDLHFTDNEAERNQDKLWKLRSVRDKMQQRFLAGWTLLLHFFL